MLDSLDYAPDGGFVLEVEYVAQELLYVAMCPVGCDPNNGYEGYDFERGFYAGPHEGEGEIGVGSGYLRFRCKPYEGAVDHYAYIDLDSCRGLIRAETTIN